MEFISTIGKSFTFLFASKIIFVGILGVSYVLLCSIYSELKLFRNKDFIFLGFSLPSLGYVITTVIGTNIALSLGMVGALSIIRFRTPVRSPYELIIYFALFMFKKYKISSAKVKNIPNILLYAIKIYITT